MPKTQMTTHDLARTLERASEGTVHPADAELVSQMALEAPDAPTLARRIAERAPKFADPSALAGWFFQVFDEADVAEVFSAAEVTAVGDLPEPPGPPEFVDDDPDALVVTGPRGDVRLGDVGTSGEG